MAGDVIAAVPLIVVSGLTTVVFVVDQWLGAPLSFAGTFGYSPLYGARYYGIGNEMSGLLLGSAMVACALVLDTWRDAPWARRVRDWGWPVLGAIVLLTAAAPFLGANVGTVAWMTVGFLVGWLMLTGRRVWTWRNALIVVLAVVVIVAGLAAIDLLGASGSVTHLGRAIRDASGEGGLSGLWTLVARKAETNLRVFGRTNWTWLLIAVLSAARLHALAPSRRVRGDAQGESRRTAPRSARRCSPAWSATSPRTRGSSSPRSSWCPSG